MSKRNPVSIPPSDPNKTGSFTSILNNFRDNRTGSHMTKPQSPPTGSSGGQEATVNEFQGKTESRGSARVAPGSPSLKSRVALRPPALHGF